MKARFPNINNGFRPRGFETNGLTSHDPHEAGPYHRLLHKFWRSAASATVLVIPEAISSAERVASQLLTKNERVSILRRHLWCGSHGGKAPQSPFSYGNFGE